MQEASVIHLHRAKSDQPLFFSLFIQFTTQCAWEGLYRNRCSSEILQWFSLPVNRTQVGILHELKEFYCLLLGSDGSPSCQCSDDSQHIIVRQKPCSFCFRVFIGI